MSSPHQQVLQILRKSYPLLESELSFQNMYQLFVAVVLSAQCTDKRVNLITPMLFARYPDFQSLAIANTRELTTFIQSCGLYSAKTRYLNQSARIIVEHFQGKVPHNRSDLEALPGVGRKTANVLLSVGFGIPAFAVDTHVGRLSRRLGWSSHTDPAKIESDVCALFPPDTWHDLHHALILHGRRICTARKPLCTSCPIAIFCPSRMETSTLSPASNDPPFHAK